MPLTEVAQTTTTGKPVSKKTEQLRKVKELLKEIFNTNPAIKSNPKYKEAVDWVFAQPGVFGAGMEKIFPALFPDPKVGAKITLLEAYNRTHKDESSLRDKAREWKLKKGVIVKFTINEQAYGASTLEITAINPPAATAPVEADPATKA